MPNQSPAYRQQQRVNRQPLDEHGKPLLCLRLLNAGAVPVVEVRGDLDMGTIHLLTDLIDEFVAVEAPPMLMVDLGRVDFLGAHGITALLHIRQTLLGCRGHLILRDPPALTRMVLTITGVIDAFDIQYSARDVVGRRHR